jgi:hypothetical protein
MRRALLLAALLALASPAVSAADDLGRLFFTPEERQALDARRTARLPDKPAAVVAAPSVRLDGYVKRSGGKSTVWVNGEALDTPPRLPAGSETRVSVRDGGRAVLLKPGETLERGNNKVNDIIGGGQIEVRRNSSQP